MMAHKTIMIVVTTDIMISPIILVGLIIQNTKTAKSHQE